MGKIQYPESKKGVFPPTSWDPALAERSAVAPEEHIELEWAYGYAGQYCTSPNLFYTR